MEAFLVSTGVVALAEIGDKTQLLAFVLAASFAAGADHARHPGRHPGQPRLAGLRSAHGPAAI